MIGRIRLAWWREALERLDQAPPPPEPMLEAAARHLLPAGLTGRVLAGLEEGWTVLLDPAPLGEADLRAYASRGERLFDLSRRLVPGSMDEAKVRKAGRVWALVDLARRSTEDDEIAAALGLARHERIHAFWPAPLRPLGMLYVLAVRDAEAGLPLERAGSPSRLLRMMTHRLTGR